MRHKLNYIFNLCLTLLNKAPIVCNLLWRCFKLFDAYQAGNWEVVLKELLYIGIIFIKGVLSKGIKKDK